MADPAVFSFATPGSSAAPAPGTHPLVDHENLRGITGRPAIITAGNCLVLHDSAVRYVNPSAESGSREAAIACPAPASTTEPNTIPATPEITRQRRIAPPPPVLAEERPGAYG